MLNRIRPLVLSSLGKRNGRSLQQCADSEVPVSVDVPGGTLSPIVRCRKASSQNGERAIFHQQSIGEIRRLSGHTSPRKPSYPAYVLPSSKEIHFLWEGFVTPISARIHLAKIRDSRGLEISARPQIHRMHDYRRSEDGPTQQQ